MSEAETMSRAGEDLFPDLEAKTVVAGFLSELRGFADDVHTRFKQQDERMTLIHAKMTHASGRPMLAAGEVGAPHQKAFDAYVRSGDDTGFRSLASVPGGFEGKAMTTVVAADGGVLVSPLTAETIRAILVNTASIRSIATVVTVDATSYDVLIDRGDVGIGWATETTVTAETSTGILEKINIPLHELSAQPKASQRLLDDAAFDIEAWLATRIAERFSRAESEAFIKGDGVNKPKGFLSYPASANGSWSWGNIGYIPTGVAGGLTNIDPVVDLVYSLGAQYRAGAAFVMNSKTTGVLRKLKDADGRFLWSDGVVNAEPPRLMGYKVLICEDMPDVGASSYSVAFGNFEAGYTVAERPDLRILRDPYSAKPHVLFYATKRVGGAVSDFAAIKLLRFAVS